MSGNDDDLIASVMEGSVYPDPLLDFLDELRTLGKVAVPAPSRELAAVLRAERPARPAALRRPVRPLRRVAGALLLAASIAVVAAAETHDLPAPAQRVVSNLINQLSPLHWDGIAHLPFGRVQRPPQRRPAAVEPGTVHRLTAHPSGHSAALDPVLSAMHVVPAPVHRVVQPKRGAAKAAHAKRHDKRHDKRHAKRHAKRHGKRHGKRHAKSRSAWLSSRHAQSSWPQWPQHWVSAAQAWHGRSQHRGHAARTQARHHQHHGHHVRHR